MNIFQRESTLCLGLLNAFSSPADWMVLSMSFTEQRGCNASATLSFWHRSLPEHGVSSWKGLFHFNRVRYISDQVFITFSRVHICHLLFFFFFRIINYQFIHTKKSHFSNWFMAVSDLRLNSRNGKHYKVIWNSERERKREREFFRHCRHWRTVARKRAFNACHYLTMYRNTESGRKASYTKPLTA